MYCHRPPVIKFQLFRINLDDLILSFFNYLEILFCDICRNILKQPVFIKANGGICNYLYLLRPHEAGGTKEDAGTVLGKFQITWRTNLGEPGRLQTRNIHNNLV